MSLSLGKTSKMKQRFHIKGGSRRWGSVLGSSITYSITLASLVGLGFLALIAAPGVGTDKALATETPSKVNVNVTLVLSIALEAYDTSSAAWVSSDDLSMGVTPGTFKTAAARVTVGTNSPRGLTFSMNDDDSNNDLVESEDTPAAPTKPVIASITSDVTIDDPTDSTNKFANNTWGYNLSATTPGSTAPPTVPLQYSEVPITEEQIIDTSSAGEVAYVFTMGARADQALPAGTYEDKVVFTVVANPEPVKYMQDIATYCPSLSQDQTMQLVDQRDDQEYTVFKAADGNCWMGENLRFGINPDGTGHPFTSADVAGSDPNLDSTKMQDLIYDSTNPNTAGRIKNGDSGMMTADNSQNAFSGNGDNYTEPYINIYQANTVADYDGQTKYGVLYNYCTATGGTACTDSSTAPTVSGSVCPAGWTLPSYATASTGTPSSSDVNKSWQKFLNNYGIVDGSTSLSTLTASPLNFVRAGYANSGQLSGRSSSGHGFYWSASPYPSVARFAYDLYFDSFLVLQDGDSRFSGFSVRCVSN